MDAEFKAAIAGLSLVNMGILPLREFPYFSVALFGPDHSFLCR